MQPMQPPGPYTGQPYPQQQQQQQPQYAPQGYPPQGYPRPPQQAPGKRRNVGLIIAGLVLLGIGALAFLVFAYNAYQYATVEEHFADIQGSAWVVEIVKKADMRRMMIFGPVATVFGLAGLVLSALGMRKR
jgi:hypothetical protein